eukprot:1627796-Alexandrium_andersonii.AAC.1
MGRDRGRRALTVLRVLKHTSAPVRRKAAVVAGKVQRPARGGGCGPSCGGLLFPRGRRHGCFCQGPRRPLDSGPSLACPSAGLSVLTVGGRLAPPRLRPATGRPGPGPRLPAGLPL